MPTIGAEMLIADHGKEPMDVAIAMVEGSLKTLWIAHLDEVVTPMFLEAAKLQVAARKSSAHDLTPRPDKIEDGSYEEVLPPPSRRLEDKP